MAHTAKVPPIFVRVARVVEVSKVASIERILCVITLHKDRVGGGVPIFLARDQEELDQMALYLSKALLGMIHEIAEGTYAVVKH